MKKFSACYFLIILVLTLSACGPSQTELLMQTAVVKTSVAASWTSTPTLMPTLTPTPTKTPLPTATPVGGGQGQLIFLSNVKAEVNKDIYMVNLDGTGRRQLTFLNGLASRLVWSPFGDKIAFSFKQDYPEGFWQLYTMNADGSALTKISKDDQKNYYDPKWSPNGKQIVYYSEQDDSKNKTYSNHDIFIINSDGSNEFIITNDPEKPYDDNYDDQSPNWSPDGRKILFVSNRYPYYYYGIYTINLDGTDSTRLMDFDFQILDPILSPDGKYIMFISDKDNKPNIWDIYIMKSDGTDIVRVLYDKKDDDTRYNFTPDSTKITFESCCRNISIMNFDGSNVEVIYDDIGYSYYYVLRP